MKSCHTLNKTCLHALYTDRQVHISSVSSSNQPVEDEKIFWHRGISFQFSGTGFRIPEQMVMDVWIPEESCSSGFNIQDCRTAYEDWLLRLLSPPVSALSESMANDRKDTREKLSFSMQKPGPVVLSRNGCRYVAGRRSFQLKIFCRFALINGTFLNGKNSYRGIKALLDLICDTLETADYNSLSRHILLYSRQQQIRAFLRKNNLLAFIADGSILPRENGTHLPLAEAVPFQSPPHLRLTIPTLDGHGITGMAIARGITVITGGGYSGKSTLLDCLEQGIYNHVEGDGREYVLSDESACKVYAEDGRYLHPTDLSPFFSYLPGKSDRHHFQTAHASGSVSQAANIVEAVYGGSRCLLIDEDTSATNFMIRDETMRRLVKKEPIIPYTDRILELKELGVSTILVIGGSGEYLKYADHILLLEDYLVYDVTEQLAPEKPTVPVSGTHSWMCRQFLFSSVKEDPLLFLGRYVQFEQTRCLKIGNYSADITHLSALTESGQPASLVHLLETLLSADGRGDIELKEGCEAAVETLFSASTNTVRQNRLWLEQVRSLDLIMAACRLRPQ